MMSQRGASLIRLAVAALSVFVVGAAPAFSHDKAPRNEKPVDLANALRTQLVWCWNPPMGAPHPEDLVVDFDLLLNEDGSVAQLPQLIGDSKAAAANNPYTRAAAVAAREAILRCAPYKLPRNRYSEWREIKPLHFDPRWIGR
jgi:hypothetical protein